MDHDTAQLLLQAFEAGDDGLAIYDARRRLVICNRRYRRMLGPASDALAAGTPWEDVLQACAHRGVYADPEDTQREWAEVVTGAFRERTSPLRIGLSGGGAQDVAVRDLEGGFLVTRRAIAERSGNAREAPDTSALIRRVVEVFPAPVLMTRAKSGRILFKSAEIDTLFGTSEWTTTFYERPADRAAFLAALRRTGQVRDHKARFLRPDGRPFWGAVSARLTEYEGEEVIVSYSRDLTDEIALEEELSRQRDQLYQHEKMTALGSLVAGVAHELNNPLSVVVGHAMMLAEESTDPEVQRQSRKIGDAAARCTRIVRTFMGMARQTAIRAERSDLNEIVETAVDVIRYGEDRGGLEIRCDLAPDLPPVSADADQIAQVVINLILNAEQAIRGAATGGHIVIATRHLPAQGIVAISVEDDGPGVPAELRQRIFEPFFTTKGPGQGTGIGLAFGHQIAEAHGGRIYLDGSRATGARFVVDLPVSRDVPAATWQDPASPGDNARILVIDDEPDVAELNAEVLGRAGYDVTPASDARQAADLLRRDRFDAVISDLNMPGLDGRGFFEVIEREFPDLLPRTGFVTGDTMGRASQSFLREARRPYLEKPVAPGELRSFVARLLESGDTP